MKDPTLEVINSWLKYQTEFGGLPGLQVSIRQKEKLIFNKAYGFANSTTQEKYTTNHLGRIASQSKMFSAALTLVLENKGFLKLSDLVIHHLPVFQGHSDKRFQKITIEHLISNRSGLIRNGEDSTYWELKTPFYDRKKLTQAILENKLFYNPGSQVKYSNLGFGLLGLVLESAGQDTFENLVSRFLLKPLGPFKIHSDLNFTQSKSFASGHSTPLFDGQRKIYKPSRANALASATGFCATTEATSAFLQALHQSDKILTQIQQKSLMTKKWLVANQPDDQYGYGTMFIQSKGTTFMGHSGSYPGFSSQMMHPIGSNYFISVISNSNNLVTFAIVKTIFEMLKKLKSIKLKALSEPLVSTFISALYAASDQSVIYIPLTGWLPMEESIVYRKKQDNLFYSDAVRGYAAPGEALKLTIQGAKIKRARLGGLTVYPVREFKMRFRRSFI